MPRVSNARYTETPVFFFTLQCSDVCLHTNSPAVVMASIHTEGPRKSSLAWEFLKGSRIGCRKSVCQKVKSKNIGKAF